MPKDMHGVMDEFSRGALHSGSSNGPVVKDRRQAIAIGLSEQKKLRGQNLGSKLGKLAAKRQRV